jgi:hypothetical protein
MFFRILTLKVEASINLRLLIVDVLAERLGHWDQYF